MAGVEYPAVIRQLPEADVGLEGVRGWILQGLNHQMVFFDIQPIGRIPEHSHGEQWGVVIDGEMELTIGGEMRVCRKGDAYHIPAGAPHSARIRTRLKALDFFADRNRYKAK
jgi:quercetin dioxygenase-like cupin family protein